MSTIDLSTPPAPPLNLLDSLPRRLSLTLPELQYAAVRAGGAPLPFTLTPPSLGGDLDARLGVSPGSGDDLAYVHALESLPDPAVSLTRRGLLSADDVIDAGVAGAIGLLASPELAVDLEVSVHDVRVRAWHRLGGDAVATLATADGIVFELAWLPASSWPGELARVAAIPESVPLRASHVPASLDLAYEVVDAAMEAVAGGRADLVPVLAAQSAGGVVDCDGVPMPAAEAGVILSALARETQGRLRVLIADTRTHPTTVVGSRAWVLLADGWRSLRPRHDDEGRVQVVAVEHGDLASDLAPVIAQVQREASA